MANKSHTRIDGCCSKVKASGQSLRKTINVSTTDSLQAMITQTEQGNWQFLVFVPQGNGRISAIFPEFLLSKGDHLIASRFLFLVILIA